MFGEQPPSALLRSSANLLASTPRPSLSSQPSPACYPSSHSAPHLGVPCPTSSNDPTPYIANVTYNINSLYRDSKEKKHKDQFVPPLSPIVITKGTHSNSSSVASSAGSTTGLLNNFKEQERRWKGKASLTTPPEDVVLDISCMDILPAPLHKESPQRRQYPLSKGRHSAQFVHYRNSFKSLAVIVDQVGRLLIEE
jgi:hypothetical protein